MMPSYYALATIVEVLEEYQQAANEIATSKQELFGNIDKGNRNKHK